MLAARSVARVPPLTRPSITSCRGRARPVRAKKGAEWAYPGEEGWTLGSRAPSKEAFDNIPAKDTVSNASLRYVEIVHWLFLLPPMFLSYVAFQSGVAAGAATAAQSFCMVVFPVIQAIAALTPMVLHEYEGWQIAPNSDALHVSPAQAGNQWLRQVALRYLLAFQAVGLMLFNMGTFGWDGLWAKIYSNLCVASVVGIVFGPKKALPLQMPWAPPEKETGVQNSPIPFPPLWFLLMFIVHASINVVAYAQRMGVWVPKESVWVNIMDMFMMCLGWVGVAGILGLSVWALASKGSYAYQHGWLRLALYGYMLPIGLVALPYLPVWGSAAAVKAYMFMVPSVMVMLGGFIEAGFAETVWDQWMHATAVVWMLMAFVAASLWLYPTQTAAVCRAAWAGSVKSLPAELASWLKF